ncbi:hypothetical protein P5G51_006015 [Virgibacillus sp. 179-BFC.A HS]|uniref:Uncharacterized protein n=1 Tax=Tigheibacillus jepli TaxID=3035914 RepID=A0ABU5CGP3_9BACI|nr:hypothetical protein [Virgibacillus sp. 179-BFC.A HS]MDY0405014.1 hypothetical protein [Virgibacillus sp. 179-BFC.A HS]
MNLLKLIIVIIIALFLFKILLGLLIGAALMAVTAVIILGCFYVGWKLLFR